MSRIGEIHGAANGCASCGHQFGSLERFDAHQNIDYERDPVLICRWPADLGLVRDARGVWQTPEGLAAQRAFQEKARARVASSRRAGHAQTPVEPDLVHR
jgi:hypothetical protein